MAIQLEKLITNSCVLSSFSHIDNNVRGNKAHDNVTSVERGMSKIMRKLDFIPTLKKDMSHIEIEGVEQIFRNVKYRDGLMYGNDLEFFYTSSSSYALIGVDGGVYLYDDEQEVDLEVDHLAITENNLLIVVCDDEDENRVYFEIEPQDF